MSAAFGEHPASIDDPGEPAGHHAEQRSDARQQEHRRERELNRVREITDARHHGRVMMHRHVHRLAVCVRSPKECAVRATALQGDGQDAV